MGKGRQCMGQGQAKAQGRTWGANAKGHPQGKGSGGSNRSTGMSHK